MTKFIFVTGGVMSGIGKGVTTASIAKLFQFRGFNVSILKIDPYINIDPGTMNPIEHGECFITEDVWDYKPVEKYDQVFRIAEIDQDFGTYERFIGKDIHPSHNITSGQVFIEIILKEREGAYLGKTVQMIPHATDAIRNRIESLASEDNLDVLLIECGGTVGDLESMIFLEAFRQMRLDLGIDQTCLIHVTLVPFNEIVGELKTKPTQHSVRQLQSAGLQPDFVVCRSQVHLDENSRKKISLFCNVSPDKVISNPNIDTVYEVPLVFEGQNLGDTICKQLNLNAKLVEYSPVNNFSEWKKTVDKYKNPEEGTINIVMPGKYTKIKDSYVSINEALAHAGAFNGVKIKIHWLDTEVMENIKQLKKFDGVLLTPGFGNRGVEGMIATAGVAIDERIPFLGICFGCQLLFVAFCRKYLGLEGANSTEIAPNTPHPVIDMLKEQRTIQILGGTMRLGAHEIVIKEGTRLSRAYQKSNIKERFRHRYHVSGEYAKKCVEHGLIVSSNDKSGEIINSIELTSEDHFCVGVQFHPEYKSRPWSPSPIYDAFIKECKAYKQRRKEA
ncbi:MAG: CTP synthase [Candidatus Hodarchaeota archaeon]